LAPNPAVAGYWFLVAGFHPDSSKDDYAAILHHSITPELYHSVIPELQPFSSANNLAIHLVSIVKNFYSN